MSDKFCTFLIMGVAASGKTTIAEKLAEKELHHRAARAHRWRQSARRGRGREVGYSYT